MLDTTPNERCGKIPDFTRQRVFHETSQETSVRSERQQALEATT
jgi:hypothetical protein